MQPNNWLLEIEFDSLEVQADRLNPFLYDEVSKSVAFLTKYWSLETLSEIEECMEWTSNTLKVTFEVVDNIAEFMSKHILMQTIPKKVTLTRIKD